MATRAQAALWRETMKAGARRSGALIGANPLFSAMIALVFAILSYHAQDPSLDTASGGPALNWLGVPGAWIADLLLAIAGPIVVFLVPVGVIAANRLMRDRPVTGWGKMLRGAGLGVVLMAAALAFVPIDSKLPGGWGGVSGLVVAGGIRWGLGFIGHAVVALWIGRLLALALAAGGAVIWFRSLDFSLPERTWRLPRLPFLGGEAPPKRIEGPKPQPRKVAMPDARPGPVIADRTIQPSPARAKPPKQTSLDFRDTYKLPPLDLLKPAPPNQNAAVDKAALERNARLLESVLDDFHVKGQIVEVRPGPVVTMYELEPASGIKASRVIQLADDIARNMSAISARVATIPGRSVIGIELPNAKREAVNLHELIGSQSYEDQGASLPLGAR